MKKTIIAVALAVAASGSAFAQGYFQIQGTGQPIKQTFVSGTSASASGNVDFAILWGLTTATPLIGTQGSPTASSSTVAATSWTSLLSDPSFQLAFNATTTALITGLTTTGLGAGNFSAGDVPITGTSPGSSYSLIVIGWNSAFSTPQAAQTAGAAVGWSAPITYAAGTSIATMPTLTTSGLTAFGVDPLATPEPGTMALAALGGASLLMFRRKK